MNKSFDNEIINLRIELNLLEKYLNIQRERLLNKEIEIEKLLKMTFDEMIKK